MVQDCRFFMFVSLLSCRSPLRVGGVQGIFATPIVAQDCVTLFSSPFRWYNFASPPLAGVVALLRFFAFPPTRIRPAPLSR